MKIKDGSSTLKRLRLPVWMTFIGIAVLISLTLMKLQTSEAASIPGDCDQLGCTQRFVVAPNGVKLAVKEFGNPDGPAILLIHGFAQSHLTWNHQFEDLGTVTK